MTKDIGQFLGGMVGDVIDMDVGHSGKCSGEFLRVRINLDVTKPLRSCLRVDVMGDGNETIMLLQYERLPNHCFQCGHLGHSTRECSDAADKGDKESRWRMFPTRSDANWRNYDNYGGNGFEKINDGNKEESIYGNNMELEWGSHWRNVLNDDRLVTDGVDEVRNIRRDSSKNINTGIAKDGFIFNSEQVDEADQGSQPRVLAGENLGKTDGGAKRWKRLACGGVPEGVLVAASSLGKRTIESEVELDKSEREENGAKKSMSISEGVDFNTRISAARISPADRTRMEFLRIRLGFSSKLVVESLEISGGLCLLWKDEVSVDLLSYSQFRIDLKIQSHMSMVWLLTGFYGNSETVQRCHSWTLLKRIRGMSQISWLYDLGFRALTYTWCNKRRNGDMVQKQLDCWVGYFNWQQHFSNSIVRHLEYWNSDHRLISVEVLSAMDCAVDNKIRCVRRFHFEACWIDRDGCRDLIKRLWVPSGQKFLMGRVVCDVQRCTKQLSVWNCKNRAAIRATINEHQEKLRRATSFIRLGAWQMDLEGVIVGYFTDLFKSEEPPDGDMAEVLGCFPNRLSQRSRDFLDNSFTEEEVSLKCLNEVASLKRVNDTLICLIPKVKMVERATNFRPISLCNVLYKIVAKCLANKLRLVLGEVVSEAQIGEGLSDLLDAAVRQNVYKGFKSNKSFVEVEKADRGSHLWKSIYWGHGLVDCGYRWRIGGGSSVSIYKDKWLPRPVTFKVISPCVRTDLKFVSQLKSASGAWNDVLIREVFLEDDVTSTLSIPTSRGTAKGGWGWVMGRDTRWNPPREGIYKINCDASVDAKNELVGLGLVIRNHLGEVMATGAYWLKENFSPKITEAIAVLYGINLDVDTSLHPFMVETDALGGVHLVNEGSPSLTDIGLVIGDILTRLKEVDHGRLLLSLGMRIMSHITCLNWP
ncbi:hypothetical protein Dsin_015896 [Dipteronia sinensis]|uniref:CCHC-type domain-containing protein n=1 Tax=Dipteronia sinensis TaxID=43782 RepID=A0AAE0E5G9_9ROSI|nr:hypothetical protein Dsin_015896 [Dipteronia sinensis]